ncbi:MAG: glutamate synthase [Kiritimatiellae bacterium]|nr:glutamate synthase [Kiritimatiellia bacterium]
MSNFAEQFVASREKLVAGIPRCAGDPVEEGGCGVVGFAATVPVSGRNIFQASIQMHNRGNGKGGGIAAAGMDADQLGVNTNILKNDYMLQVALLDSAAENQVEQAFITNDLRVDHKEVIQHIDDYHDIDLEVKPPDVVRYFVRVKEASLARFVDENGLQNATPRSTEDEFICQNSFKLNQRFYASLGEKQAFVMSHARDLCIFKIVGYAEQVVKYYMMEDIRAHIWIAHQRYPTKGRVWHPAGAHPFIGMNQALVHNGDFANYFSISEYLRQHNVVPQFLTDTEVSVQLFDMLERTYGYPLEYIIEALAPTSEMDFDCLPAEKKKIYRAIQAMHMHGSPDGPWFFIIASSNPDKNKHRLIGITDTAMLRPQVFAIQSGDVSIGLVASEKQAIDATLETLSADDPRFRPIADRYWNARGGSHTDGGAFTFTLKKNAETVTLVCADKFGNEIASPSGDLPTDTDTRSVPMQNADLLVARMQAALLDGDVNDIFFEIVRNIVAWSFADVRWLVNEIAAFVNKEPAAFEGGITILSLLNDRRFDCGSMRRSVFVQYIRASINMIMNSVPAISSDNSGSARRIDWQSRNDLRAPHGTETTLVVAAADFPPEGNDCNARIEVAAYELGWKRFILYGLRGQRFTGCGFGSNTDGVRIDVFGSSGDYLSSGNDGIEIHVHDNAQDQLCQIMKRGKLVVYGDVGQTFMYGAKGGDVYILGNAAGRPLINAVGCPRVVINGTCLDFLAESFMAGDPLNGGGFVVLNGVMFDDHGGIIDLESPYPGVNLFSLASGGAIYVRDPDNKLVDEQLNGGKFVELSDDDWALIHPYLKTNEEYFGISVEDHLLTVDGARLTPERVYRKVEPDRGV